MGATDLGPTTTHGREGSGHSNAVPPFTGLPQTTPHAGLSALYACEDKPSAGGSGSHGRSGVHEEKSSCQATFTLEDDCTEGADPLLPEEASSGRPVPPGKSSRGGVARPGRGIESSVHGSRMSQGGRFGGDGSEKRLREEGRSGGAETGRRGLQGGRGSRRVEVLVGGPEALWQGVCRVSERLSGGGKEGGAPEFDVLRVAHMY